MCEIIKKWEKKYSSLLSDYPEGILDNETLQARQREIDIVIEIINDLKELKDLSFSDDMKELLRLVTENNRILTKATRQNYDSGAW